MSIYVGLGLLSKPYAVAKGGWVSIGFCGLFSFVANFSGKMLVKCFETPSCQSSKTYANVADRVLGFWGAMLVICVASAEFLIASCICMLFIWANIEQLLPSVQRWYIVGISSAVTLPTVWIIKLGEASWLSLLGFISTLLIVFTLVFVRAYYGELEDVDLDNIVGPDLPLSLGIFMLSLAGHAALPQVYREMSTPSDFNSMLNFCFVMIFIMYGAAGAVGYSIYGAASDIIVSTNMVSNPGGVLPKITAGFIITKNYLTLNPLLAVLCNSIEVILGIDEARGAQRIFRTHVFLGCAGLAYVCSDILPFLESILGAVCTMMTSFILPGILFALLSKDSSSWKVWFSSRFVFAFGIIMMVFLTYGAVNSLLHPDDSTF